MKYFEGFKLFIKFKTKNSKIVLHCGYHQRKILMETGLEYGDAILGHLF